MAKLWETVKISVILFLITAISALLLAYVNNITSPLIAENEKEKINNALNAVCKADAFLEIEKTQSEKLLEEEYDGEIISIYEARSGEDERVGICAIIETKGYDAGLRCVIGVDENSAVTGVEIISHNETPGLGANAAKDEFKSQYKGKNSEISVVKANAGDNEINAISGATMTSKGVTRAVNLAMAISENLK